MRKVNDPMLTDKPFKLKIKPRECATCGGKFIPTGNRQKYCPDCRRKMTEKARNASLMKKHTEAVFGEGSYKEPETPEDKMTIETPERPALPEDWAEQQRQFEKPDWEALVEEAAQILIKYGRGELVEKNAFLEEIREKLLGL